MSGDHYYGPTVNMYGGQGNQGIVNYGTTPSPTLDSAVQELLRLLQDLRAQVPPLAAQSIDEALPALAPAADVPPRERHRALMAVAGIAATAGAIGQPVLDSVRALLELLGA
ncbi:hypothetical protein J7E93_11405 [Streptomyces sp. ISL-36]|uniref:hypothetical protein n=1 Tax=Streptomyces sp. ISL-36 TaxID=2819182 RepID=UPI001BE729AF|nr:hypothetical protein [Streptomyces sp. ISL-36]MBT2440703.1 hypothetical protein [Streptomyces sp. ISL-36]